MYKTNITKATINGKVITSGRGRNEIEVRWNLSDSGAGVKVYVDSIRVTSCDNYDAVAEYKKNAYWNSLRHEIKCECGKKTWVKPGRYVFCEKCGRKVTLCSRPAKLTSSTYSSTVYKAYALKQNIKVEIETILKWGRYMGRSVRVKDAMYNTAKNIGVTACFSVKK